MTPRTHTRVVHIGGVPVGGGNPIVVQSMTNTDTRDVAATVAQIHALQAAGCEIVRVAVVDTEAAAAIRAIKQQINIPLVADIHFNHHLALESIKNGADKLRINPGNIGPGERIRAVAEAAKAAQIPIRVGVNGGSLEKDLLAKYNGVTAEGLAESALRNIAQLEQHGFDQIVVSVKASSVPLLIDAHKRVAARVPYPLHIGLTEAGTPHRGAIRSAAGLGALLSLGIGDTIRVSLSGDPTAEIPAAQDILTAMGLRPFGPTVIACPTCGRTTPGVADIAASVEARVAHIKKPLTIAVMGCEVNGPGEARAADIGIAFGRGGFGLLFKKGEVVAKLAVGELEEALVEAVGEL
ncbi:MAG: flavodoxin-dependent (E)-4-hydroxy-3-methylbut-2-enyl-diphosphate synthase [Defluviitaleaceae bacterium]|nr:flavodoxin-dependent (E)-4-hydroxy-3-methylbut-2-enyl-diphosphate synthase [Defluviitaleaceae bacterium]